MKVAVIGAGGFLGRALSAELHRQGHEVTGYGPSRRDDTPYAFCEMDVLGGDVRFESGTDAVFFLAQSPHYRDFPSHADHLFGVNALGPVRCLRAAVESGASFFLNASTGSVYAPSFEPLAEDAPLARNTPYVLSKLHGEEAAALFAEHIRTVSARFFGLFGPGQTRLLPHYLYTCVRDGREITLQPRPGTDADAPCDGLRLSFTYTPDAAAALIALMKKGLSGAALPQALNVAPPTAMSIRGFCERMGRVVGREPVFVRQDSPRTTNLIADTTLLSGTVGTIFTPHDEAVERSFSGQSA